MSDLYEFGRSEYRVHPKSFRLRRQPTAPDGNSDKAQNRTDLAALVAELSELQTVLAADNRYGLLLVFQAMDAAGKDGTIRAVLSGVNPAGCEVTSFKAPSTTELDHDYMWRIAQAMPPKGHIGVFNRSHYEEVLAVKVMPQYLAAQRLPRAAAAGNALWKERYQSICDFERHWARNGTVILKFFLNVSKAEQAKRLVERIDDKKANWKFSPVDVEMRKKWGDYMHAYEDALRATSTAYAPWYAIPADSKSYMRKTVAEIVVQTLRGLKLKYPNGTTPKPELHKLRALLA
ncbi:MAG: polyphosphate kinase 2 family protein [Myxococcales bacterium]|nr:polyphosphate kinase 2 family protein [Myxococcales bacterium]